MKRNLWVVVGGVVAAGLLAVAVLFLLKKVEADRAMTDQLTLQTATLEQLTSRKPYPSPENIEAAKATQERLQEFLQTLQQLFQGPELPEDLDNRTFRAMLDNTVSRLRNQAGDVGMKLPENYWFSFGNQKAVVQFSDIDALAMYRADVEAMCQILIDAQVNNLIEIRRPKTEGEKTAGGDAADYVEEEPQTNQWTIVAPYRITFEAFSPELEQVMEKLVGSDTYFIIKDMAVQAAPEEDDFVVRPRPRPAQAMPMQPQYNPGASRYGAPMTQYGGGGYGGYNRGFPPPRQPMPVRPAGRPEQPAEGNQINLVDERLTRYTLSLSVVRNKQTKKKS